MFARSISTSALAHQMRKSPLLVIITLTTVALSVIGISARTWYRSASTRHASSFVNVQAQGKRQPLALITIRPQGVEPTEITRPKGKLFIVVENRSGLDSVTLRLDREAGARLKEIQVPLSKLDWDEGFDLTPGRYVLTEAAHPDWVCHINVTAQ